MDQENAGQPGSGFEGEVIMFKMKIKEPRARVFLLAYSVKFCGLYEKGMTVFEAENLLKKNKRLQAVMDFYQEQYLLLGEGLKPYQKLEDFREWIKT